MALAGKEDIKNQFQIERLSALTGNSDSQQNMETMKYYIFGAITIYLLINIIATRRCIKSDWFSSRQVLMHTLIIWLIPLIGGVSILLFYHTFSEEIKPNYKSFGGGASKHLFDTTRRW